MTKPENPYVSLADRARRLLADLRDTADDFATPAPSHNEATRQLQQVTDALDILAGALGAADQKSGHTFPPPANYAAMNQALNMVGGHDRFIRIVAWAENVMPEETQRLLARCSTSDWPNALADLIQAYEEAHPHDLLAVIQ